MRNNHVVTEVVYNMGLCLFCTTLIGLLPAATSGTQALADEFVMSDVEAVAKKAEAPDEAIEEAALLQPQQPLAPQRPLPPPVAPSAASSELSASLFGPGGANRSLLAERRSQRAAGAASNVVFGSEAKPRQSTDTGSLLGRSPSVTGLGVQRRTPIVTDPKVRGRSAGQQLASGSYWFPARQDLDTLLSKIDSRLVQDVIVIKGPYSSLYGPGFSFYDVDLLDAPRFACGPEWHGSTSLDYQTNGEQIYGRQSVWGGSSDWGFRAGYGHRTGNDYESGDGTGIPSSYKSRDVDVAIGMDLSPDSHIELNYLRLDQTDVEYPGQLFDMDFLVTDAFDVKYTLENQSRFDIVTIEAWYNRTRFEGNAQRSGKRRQIPELDALSYLGFTDADLMSTGFRAATTWESNCSQLTLGADLRYLKQELNEFDVSPFLATSIADDDFNSPIPRAHSANPGLFAQHLWSLTDRLTVKSGARLDWVSTDAARFADHTDYNGDGQPDDLEAILGAEFDQNFALWSAFITGEFRISDHCTSLAGFGYAMRPPTMTELYAANPVLAILQQGATFVFGDPRLDPERLWQIDLGIAADYGSFRGGVHGYYAWIQDYITYESFANFPNIPDSLGVVFVNTDLATLSGGEIYGEYDWNCYTTPFATVSYVEGRDHSRGDRGVLIPPDFFFGDEEPLPGIAPLESRLGVRFHDPCERPRWVVEFSARIVDNQDRVASSLLEHETSGFTTYDLRSYYRAYDNVLLVAGVENFTDKQYREHLDLRTGSGVFQPGASYYFGVEVTY
jgi:outer membrane receptor protein involved in Fe transport